MVGASPPTLLIAAHGTRSTAGRATTRRVSDAVAAARTDLTVRLAYLDVARPSLQEMLTAASEPTVVVPLLLTAGYHVLTDIPAVTGASRRVRVAGHLGADELVIDALVDRLREVAGSRPARSTVLARVGSSRAEADADARVAVDLLARRLGRDVGELSLGSDVRAAVAALPAPVEVATYLLAEGEFFERARSAVDGLATMAAPLGAHPSVVELVLIRYDAAVTQWSQR